MAVISNPLLILLSGPESARTDFENKVLEELGNYQGAAVMVRGLPDGKEEKIIQDNRIVIYNHLVSGQLNELINRSAIVISRSGYSTIMDLARLGKKAVLVPTPGQPEDAFNLDACLKEISQSAIGFPEFPEEDLLGKLVGEFLTRIRKNHPLEYRKK
jgi:UDP:flavonoid glycosyltransferase YjiC (YdhE family)